jgi:hypothetical protein
VIRTIEEVRTRYVDKDRQSKDFFGFAAEVLGVHLPEGWKEGSQDKHKEFPLTEEFVKKEAIEYLHFAFGKALDHRGISASRSVQKMREYAWLLCMDEAVAFADNDSNYPNYGVPVLKHMARAFGVELPEDIAKWEDGAACTPGCEEGCGQ